MKALINARIYDYHEYHENAYVLFDKEIIEVGPMQEFNRDLIDNYIDVKNAFVLPGFVCGHTHLYSAFARGMSIPFNPKSFKDVLKQMWWKLDHFLDLDMVYYSALVSGLEQMKKGTTTLIDHHAGNEIKGSLKQIRKALTTDIKMRSILAFETSDRYDQDAAISENVNYIKKYRTAFTSGLFGLHASFTLSEDTLSKVSKNLRNTGIHIHVAESIKDEEDSMKKYDKTVVERLRDHNLLNENSLLIHCTNVSEKELNIIKDSKAYVCVNTTSNMNNAVGLPNIRLMDELGIKLMIGNDGLIQSMPIEYLNAYYSAHLETKNPNGFSIDSIKKMITNSYDYVNSQLHIKLGKIKKGYKADLIVVPYKEFSPLDKNNVFGHVFFGLFPGLLPKHVIIDGKTRIKNYLVKPKLEAKTIEAINQAQKLWDTIKKEGNNLKFED
ncbi:MAG: amidohydrolase family protein [Tenericutes bacterium]|nr:amidohydrolase family protein [Mycoplasmatota bacterium]